MRLKWLGLCLCLGAVIGGERVAAAQEGGAISSVEALRARCPTTRNLAPGAFARSAGASAAELDAWQARIRGHLRAEGPPPNAEVVLRAFAGASMTQSERSETATVVWRLPDGSWHFVEANHYPNRQVSPPPPPARLTDEQVEAARRSIGGGALDGAQAAALDALLADPCLEAEPEIVAGGLPLRAGIVPMQPCYDAVAQTVELVRAGRRRVYVQTCRHFLAGELIGLALYPRVQSGAPTPTDDAPLASLESTRRYADQALRASHGGEAWANATGAAGEYAFVHRPSGFRCAATEPSEIQVYAGDPNEPAADRARCLRNSFLRVRSGVFKTEWRVVRRRRESSVRHYVREAADDWFSGYHGSSAARRIRMSSVSWGGVRMSRAEVAGEPQIDAREDELTIVLGAEHDGWIVVARATGSATDPAAVEAVALADWRRAVRTRVPPPG